MKKGLAEIICIIDRSGSMDSIRNDSIGGFNTFIEEQKKLDGEANVTLVLFDHEYIECYNGKPINEVELLNEATYVPRGSTALLDAVGKTVVTVGERLDKLADADKPEKVIVTILTDGQENASAEYTQDRVAELIKNQQDTYSWEFIFLGANMDATAVAASYNIKTDNAFDFAATSAGTKCAYRTISTAVSGMRNTK